MSVSTSNAYGKISISDLAIAKVAAQAALESYGIVDTASRHFTDTFAELFKKDAGGKGVKVVTSGNRIFIDISVLIKYGVSIEAVAESLKEAIKYKVENFTGMIVDSVNVNVIGVRTQSSKGQARMSFTVEIASTESLGKAMQLISEVGGVMQVKRH